LRWLTNTYDPSRIDARAMHSYISGVDRALQWQWHLEWLRDKVIGDPQPSEHFTVAQLKAAHYVGIYARDDS